MREGNVRERKTRMKGGRERERKREKEKTCGGDVMLRTCEGVARENQE